MRRRMMMKSKEDVFVLEMFEATYNSTVTVGRTTSLSVKASLPIRIDGIVYDVGGVVDGIVDTSKILEKVIILDSDGIELDTLKYSNKAAIVRGRASYAAFNTPVKIEEAIDYTFHFVAINIEGKRSKPLTITITGVDD